jgi:riboflavin kinase/FMN adenylyltransferase
MKVWSIHEPLSIRRPVATIGIFDGVHAGHRFILAQLVEKARNHGGESVVVTLWPHPRVVLNKDAPKFRLLHSRDEKIRELGKEGVDHLLFVPFNREVASLTACEFIQKFLVDLLDVEVLLVGYDNKFGRDRMGDPEGLARCAEKNVFRIEKLPEFNPEGGSVSSTSIREALSKGDLVSAKSMLGYTYSLSGIVVEGTHIGRQMGFPTANIHPRDPYKLIPMNGVYAIRAELMGKIYGGMLNIGFRPTLDSAAAVKTIETHLFEASGDFYGEQIVLHFIERVRDEMKFRGMEDLKKQLQQDEIHIKKLLS